MKSNLLLSAVRLLLVVVAVTLAACKTVRTPVKASSKPERTVIHYYPWSQRGHERAS